MRGLRLEDHLQVISMTLPEYRRLVQLLGRSPNPVELGVVGALWSEHCAYKSSAVHLRRLPREGPHVLVGPGENAGVVRIKGDWVAVFKIESHNHPSAIEPYQGAATGVGGIVRDILALGVRPTALLNSLRFGRPEDPQTRRLLNGVVSGIADYGNCIGVPTVGGEISFHPGYQGNPLVNVLCLGIGRQRELRTARAKEKDVPLVLMGARTGRDGIHGATFASLELTEKSEEDRPAVQIGDPFREKLLIEAVLEIRAQARVLAMQDLGAAGLAGASAEIAGKSGAGVVLQLERVPRREAYMKPYEILLSESQERMLLAVHPEDVGRVLRIAQKWHLHAQVVGHLTADGRFRARWKEKLVTDLPVRLLTEEAPRYERPMEPQETEFRSPERLLARLRKEDPEELLARILEHPRVISRHTVYEQYDHTVQTQTVRGPGLDAAILQPHGADFRVALTTDCNEHYCALTPRQGAQLAVAEALANILCAGALPLGITDCLNFGNPEHPRVMWSFREAVEGLAEAARFYGIPVVSGNVSFYNESPQGAVPPTPVVGMVGGLPEIPRHEYRAQEGDLLYLLGEPGNGFGGSVVAEILGEEALPPPVFPRFLREGIAVLPVLVHRYPVLLHDISEGGLLAALVEALAFVEGPGARLEVPWEEAFAENIGNMLLFVPPERAGRVEEMLREGGLPFRRIGALEGDELIVNGFSLGPLKSLVARWRKGLPR